MTDAPPTVMGSTYRRLFPWKSAGQGAHSPHGKERSAKELVAASALLDSWVRAPTTPAGSVLVVDPETRCFVVGRERSTDVWPIGLRRSYAPVGAHGRLTAISLHVSDLQASDSTTKERLEKLIEECAVGERTHKVLVVSSINSSASLRHQALSDSSVDSLTSAADGASNVGLGGPRFAEPREVSFSVLNANSLRLTVHCYDRTEAAKLLNRIDSREKSALTLGYDAVRIFDLDLDSQTITLGAGRPHPRPTPGGQTLMPSYDILLRGIDGLLPENFRMTSTKSGSDWASSKAVKEFSKEVYQKRPWIVQRSFLDGFLQRHDSALAKRYSNLMRQVTDAKGNVQLTAVGNLQWGSEITAESFLKKMAFGTNTITMTLSMPSPFAYPISWEGTTLVLRAPSALSTGAKKADSGSRSAVWGLDVVQGRLVGLRFPHGKPGLRMYLSKVSPKILRIAGIDVPKSAKGRAFDHWFDQSEASSVTEGQLLVIELASDASATIGESNSSASENSSKYDPAGAHVVSYDATSSHTVVLSRPSTDVSWGITFDSTLLVLAAVRASRVPASLTTLLEQSRPRIVAVNGSKIKSEPQLIAILKNSKEAVIELKPLKNSRTRAAADVGDTIPAVDEAEDVASTQLESRSSKATSSPPPSAQPQQAVFSPLDKSKLEFTVTRPTLKVPLRLSLDASSGKLMSVPDDAPRKLRGYVRNTRPVVTHVDGKRLAAGDVAGALRSSLRAVIRLGR